MEHKTFEQRLEERMGLMYKAMFMDFKNTFMKKHSDVDEEFMTALFFAQLKIDKGLHYLDGWNKLTDKEQEILTKILEQ